MPEIQIKFHLSIAIAQYLNEVAKHCQSDFYTQFMDGLWRNLESAGNKRVWKKQDLIYEVSRRRKYLRSIILTLKYNILAK